MAHLFPHEALASRNRPWQITRSSFNRTVFARGSARMSDSLGMGTLHARSSGAIGPFLLAVAACGSVADPDPLFEPGVRMAGPRPAAYLNFPADAVQAPRPDDASQPDFPRLLSQTGAFRNVAELE